jgi:uncharacterized protein YjeT (DUF2065 family)
MITHTDIVFIISIPVALLLVVLNGMLVTTMLIAVTKDSIVMLGDMSANQLWVFVPVVLVIGVVIAALLTEE